MAKRAFEIGWKSNRQSWARPIKTVIEEERKMARMKAIQLAQQAEEDRIKKMVEDHRKASEEAATVLANEALMLNASRKGIMAGLGILGIMQPAMKKLAEMTLEAINRGEIPAKKGMEILGRWTTCVAQLTHGAKENVETERLRKGEPTEVIGMQLDVANLSVEEIEASLKRGLDELNFIKEHGVLPEGAPDGSGGEEADDGGEVVH
jgi:hypothetical protein